MLCYDFLVALPSFPDRITSGEHVLSPESATLQKATRGLSLVYSVIPLSFTSRQSCPPVRVPPGRRDYRRRFETRNRAYPRHLWTNGWLPGCKASADSAEPNSGFSILIRGAAPLPIGADEMAVAFALSVFWRAVHPRWRPFSPSLVGPHVAVLDPHVCFSTLHKNLHC